MQIPALGKTAFVTGATGQDGYYLIDLLLSKGYAVHGLIRWHSGNTEELGADIQALPGAAERLTIHFGDIQDASRMSELVALIQPDEIYNLAALSDVAHSFSNPEANLRVNGMGPLHLLDAIQQHNLQPKTRFYQASTSELFGGSVGETLSLATPFHPRSPYAAAKLYAFWMCVHYREAYNIYACNGLCFNHESPRRGQRMITRKVTETMAQIALGQGKVLEIGDPNAGRDWGHAKDFVRGMWMCLQQDTPKDHLMCTGRIHTVRDLINLTAQNLGFSLQWHGTGLDEHAIVTEVQDASQCPAIKAGDTLVTVSPKFLRPTDTRPLLGKMSDNIENWQATISFEELVAEMVQYFAKLHTKSS